MAEWIQSALDVVLILTVSFGLVQVIRLIRQLANLRQSRTDMERFVQEFNATVLRAEIGIKNLKQATRDSGDDLEKLLDKSYLVRDELRFIVESADQLAGRIAEAASVSVKPEAKVASKPKVDYGEEARSASVSPLVPHAKSESTAEPSSRAEKELLQALQKLK